VKKFYKDVGVREENGGYSVCLDGRTDADEIDPTGMILTRLANSAVDRVSAHRDAVIDEIAGFAATDLVCYRTADPVELREQQERQWTPLLVWLREENGINLRSTESVLPVEQDRHDLNAVRDAVASLDDFSLSALHMVTSACGSVVLGLATAVGKIDGMAAWELSLLEETYQINEWGEDPVATKRREILRTDIGAAARFLDLLRAGQ
jgi:chaperone required for assembly of F1-ATPase